MLTKKKVDQIVDLLLLTRLSVKQIAKMSKVSISTVRKIKLSYPLFFGWPRRYQIKRRKFSASVFKTKE